MTEFVIVKLVTGEQILAALDNEFDESVVLSFPIVLKSIPMIKDGVVFEKIATAEYCAYTDEKEFNIFRKDIVFMKPMSKTVAVMYQRTLQELYIMPDRDPIEEPEEKEVLDDTKETTKILH